MRRAGEIVSDGDRSVMTQEDCSGILDFVEHLLRVPGRDVQVLWCKQVRQFGSLSGIAGEDQSSVLIQAGQRQIATWEPGELRSQFATNFLDQRGVPRDQNSGPRTVFGLRDQIRRDKSGIR